MRANQWALPLTARTLRTNALRTLVATLSVAIGVGAFALAGMLGAAQLASVKAEVAANEGRAATIAVTPDSPLVGSDTAAIESLIREDAGSAIEVLSLNNLGTLELCRVGGDQYPSPVTVFAASGAVQSVLGSRPGSSPSAQLITKTIGPGNYALCNAPDQRLKVVPQTRGARLPGFEDASFVTQPVADANPLIFPPGVGQRAWIIISPPESSGTFVQTLQDDLDSWVKTRGSALNIDVQRVDTSEQYAASVNSTGLLLRVIALVLLFTGVLGLANVQIVLLRQRTRNFALLRAFGATSTGLSIMVLYETILICLLGGLAGTAIALALYQLLAPAFTDSVTWSVDLVGRPVILAVGASLAAGVFSGLLPAWRARRLDVSQALFG